MSEILCAWRDRREEILVCYLYGDIGLDERTDFERHLSACATCRNELAELGDVRSGLRSWSPPEPAMHVGSRSMPAEPLRKHALRDLPAWAQAAAAVLLFGLGAGLANVRVTFASDGIAVKTGWLRSEQPAAANSRPWQGDLASLEQQLKSELQRTADAMTAVHASRSASSERADTEALLRNVRRLVRDSEQRQQRELALRVAEISRETQVQRQADLVKIDRSLGLIQTTTGRTGMEVMRQQQLLNNLAVRVSQRQ